MTQVFENLLIPFSLSSSKSSANLNQIGELKGNLLPNQKVNQPSSTLTEDHLRNLFFGDYMKAKDEQRFYDEISDLENLKKVFPY